MKKTKLLVLALTFCMVFALFGCSKNEPKAAGETRTLTLASIFTDASSITRVTQDMSTTIKEETNGEIDIQLFPNSTLGAQTDFLEGVSMGTVDMCIIASGAVESFYPKFAIYSLPFLFDGTQHTYKFFQSAISEQMNEEFLAQTGMRVIGLFNEGYRQVFTKNYPVNSVSDFKGLKLRVPNVNIYVKMFTALGCNTQIVPYGEIYTGIQTGLIDGCELPLTSLYTGGIYEQVKYATMTNHIGGAVFCLVNEGVWQSLTADQQKCILDNMFIASEADQANLITDSNDFIAKMTASGVAFSDMSDEMKNDIINIMNPVLKELYGELLPDDMIESVRAMK